MYEQIIELLDQRRLKEALIQLQALASEIEDWQLSADIENIATTYTYMLQYAAQGTSDPERPKLYHSLRKKAYELTENPDYSPALLEAALPAMNNFAKQTGEYICLSVLEGDSRVILYNIMSTHPVQVITGSFPNEYRSQQN